MKFKYKTHKGQAWDTSGLGKFLKRNYPGANSVNEAIAQEKALRAQDQAHAPKTQPEPQPSSLELSPPPSQDETPKCIEAEVDDSFEF